MCRSLLGPLFFVVLFFGARDIGAQAAREGGIGVVLEDSDNARPPWGSTLGYQCTRHETYRLG